MSERTISSCAIDNVHVYKISISSTWTNYTVVHPTIKAEVGYRMGERPMGQNSFEGLGLGDDPSDAKIRELAIQLIQAIEDRIIDVLEVNENCPVGGILTEEI